MRSAEGILDILFPVSCPSCQIELDHKSSYICSRCTKNLSFGTHTLLCPICASRIPSGIICRSCRKETRLNRFFAATSYRDENARKLIWLLKYDFASSYVSQIVHLITTVLEAHQKEYDLKKNGAVAVVVPIPLSKKRKRMRSFNQSELIGRGIAKYFNLPFEEDVLTKTKETMPQSQIEDYAERRGNIRGVFTCTNPGVIRRNIVLLVDDVYTSGATMEECAYTLKKAGAKEVWGIVFAKG